MSSDYLDLVANFVHFTHWEDLSETTRDAAKNVLMDTFGAILLSLIHI